MKRIYSTILTIFIAVSALAQGWPENYGGVMLQGFYWDSFKDSKWKTLEAQADELAQYFNLIWVPQSGKCNEAKTWVILLFTTSIRTARSEQRQSCAR